MWTANKYYANLLNDFFPDGFSCARPELSPFLTDVSQLDFVCLVQELIIGLQVLRSLFDSSKGTCTNTLWPRSCSLRSLETREMSLALGEPVVVLGRTAFRRSACLLFEAPLNGSFVKSLDNPIRKSNKTWPRKWSFKLRRYNVITMRDAIGKTETLTLWWNSVTVYSVSKIIGIQ